MLASVQCFAYEQVLGGFHHFSTRMTALPFGDASCALVSPIPLTDAILSSLSAAGTVRYLIAPNMLHHLYLAAASERFPAARVLAPPALRTKRSDLRIDATLDGVLPDDLSAAVEVVRIEGAPSVDEYALFHRASRTLVVTDLVFNITRPKGWFAHALLYVVGCHGRLAQSRVWRLLVKDRAAAVRSVERLLELPFETLVMAHGEIIHDQARAQLSEALHWLSTPHRALPATT